jgi:hypothetical protein
MLLIVPKLSGGVFIAATGEEWLMRLQMASSAYSGGCE